MACTCLPARGLRANPTPHIPASVPIQGRLRSSSRDLAPPPLLRFAGYSTLQHRRATLRIMGDTTDQLLDSKSPYATRTHICTLRDWCVRSQIRSWLPSCMPRLIGTSSDIAHGSGPVIEKGLDQRGGTAVAQLGIQTFYDSAPTVRCCRWLESRGVSPALCAAVARHQLGLVVRVCCAGATSGMQCRAWGFLTGSRTAGAMGRVPVEEVFAMRSSDLVRWGYKLGAPTDRSAPILVAVAYVHNLYAVSARVGGAAAILDDCGLAPRKGLRAVYQGRQPP